MGGHGALICALRNPGKYKSVSAFAPISNPMQCPWGQKAFKGYLGDNQSNWEVSIHVISFHFIWSLTILCPLLEICLYGNDRNYVPPTEGGGNYCFWCGWRRRLRRRPRCFVSVRYLLNRRTDCDQTCTDTLLGGRNELIRFW